MASPPRTRLKAARKAERYSQRLLAETVGIHPVSMTNIELGKQEPTVSVALRIARVLGSTVEELFGEPTINEAPAPVATAGGVTTSEVPDAVPAA